MNFSIVIPTYNRPEALGACLEAVLGQSLRPTELMVIDDGDLEETLITKYRDRAESVGTSFIYYKKNHSEERRGLSESKNIALSKCQAEFIVYLDDDIVIQSGFLTALFQIWEENYSDTELIGVGGVIRNNRSITKFEKIYNRLFGLGSNKDWDITAAGFQVWNDQIKSPSQGFYAHGGLVSLRRRLAHQLSFSVFEGGRTGLEDVDFCFRAKQAGFHFIIQPKAAADHNHSREARETEYLSGQKESRNRREIFKKSGRRNFSVRILFNWSLLGWILRQFLAGHFLKGLGMIRGLR